MAITFFKSKWEMGEDSLTCYFERCKKDGFQGVELGSWNGSAKDIKDLCQQHGLRLFSQVATSGANPKEHEDALKRSVEEAIKADTETINCHLGSDFFSLQGERASFQRRDRSVPSGRYSDSAGNTSRSSSV